MTAGRPPGTARLVVAALFTAIVILAFQAGRLSATPRPAALVIPAASSPESEPDRGQRTEAPFTVGPDLGASPSPTAVARLATPQPTPRGASMSGFTLRATWYCLEGRSRCTVGYSASCYCAAISPDLAYLNGRRVRVSYGGRSVVVRIVDCNCAAHQAIDLYAAAFSQLAPLSTGVIQVKVRP